MKKNIILLSLVLIIALAVSCSDASSRGMKTVKVSTYGTAYPEGKAISRSPSVNSLELKDEIKNAVSSATVTPIAFTLNLNEISIYKPNDNSDIQGGASSWESFLPNGEYGNSRNTNILCSRGMDSLSVNYNSKDVYEGIMFAFLPFIGDSNANEKNEGVRLISALCVKLPEGIEKRKVKNQYTGEKLTNYGDDYVWFSYDQLISYKISQDAFLSYICFQTGIDEATIVGAEDHSDESYVFGPVNTSGNACALSVPMIQPLDFSKYENPEICLFYDTQDLVEFFEQPDGSYYAFFNKDNPFPLTLTIREYEPDEAVELPLSFDDEKSFPFNCIKVRREEGMLLQYTKPTNLNYRNIQIFKSNSPMTLDSANTLITAFDSSGELQEQLNLLYEGNADYYLDIMDNSRESSSSYFKRAITNTGKSALIEFSFW